MQQLPAIQILRALAAVMVVFHHVQNDAARTAMEAGAGFSRSFLLPWSAGVDLFFVVSGFVMVFSSERIFAAAGGASQFLRRRVARIVPLYWLALTIALFAALRGAAAGRVPAPGLMEIVASYVFMPFPRVIDGAPRPILSLGWTLEYEMFFYVVFACFIWLKRERAVAAVTAFLCALVAFNALTDPQNIAIAFWSDPIVLEFALGMGLALLWRRGFRLSMPGALALGIAGFAALALDPMDSAGSAIDSVDPNGFLRLFSWGLPMAVIFAVATFGPPPAQSRMTHALARLGDASYALYLFHPLALIALRKAWMALGLAQTFGYWPLVVLSTFASIAFALAICRWIETPMTKFAQRHLARRAAPESPKAKAHDLKAHG